MTKVYTYNSKQIGGNVTVIETEKSKIAIDFGANLPGSRSEDIEIEGLSEGAASFDGVFFTHYHGDHAGRMHKVLPDVPLYLGEVARKVLLNINTFCREEKMVELLKNEDRVMELHQDSPVEINGGDIVVTPYVVDHSAYEAFMFLIETKDAEGNPDKTILHTGDFRAHGYRGKKSLLPMIHYYVRKNGKRDVDILIIEGTMLSRMDEEVFTEAQLKEWASDYFAEHRHIFLICSSTNPDSLASFYHAGIENGMQMFANPYVVRQLRTFTETAGKWSSLYQFNKAWKVDFEQALEKGDFKGTQEEFMRKYGFVCIIKEGSKYEKWIERFADCDPTVIYSMWEGYLDPDRSAYNKELAGLCAKYHAVRKHTGGHAAADVIAEVIEAVNPKEAIYPIHTEKPEQMLKLEIRKDLKERIKGIDLSQKLA